MGTGPQPLELQTQVAVLGGGLAGLAVATRLARRGIDVVCIEREPPRSVRVGESLDWSSPALLRDLGFEPGELLACGLATRKRHIRVAPHDGPRFELEPEPWFARAPLRLELETLHIDRIGFDDRLAEEARRAGVRMLREKVVDVIRDGERVREVRTETRLVRAARYVDATGRSRLLARALDIGRADCGEPKVTQWTYLPIPAEGDGTTLHLDGSQGPLDWLWEIPVAPALLSVGWTQPARELRRKADALGGADAAFAERIGREPRLAAAFAAAAPQVHARSYRTYVHARASGPNWILVGEALAMVDPLTSNGFTFALRSGAHASELIEGSLARAEIAPGARKLYDSCQRRMARAFNDHIERAAYGEELRAGLGWRRATWVYVLFGFFANALCQRLRPRGRAAEWTLCAGLAGFRAWMGAWCLAARLRPQRWSDSRPNQPSPTSTPVSKPS